jgi:hypothetical protein
MSRIVVAILAAAIASAQTATTTIPTPTPIGKHHLGETIQEWEEINNDAVDCDGYNERWRWNKCKPDVLMSLIEKGESGVLKGPGGDGSGWQHEWTFVAGRLSEAVHFATMSNQEIRFLVQAYGIPGRREIIPHRNAFNARWETVDLYWELKNGDGILASQLANDVGRLAVFFVSKEARRRPREPERKNPYQ